MAERSEWRLAIRKVEKRRLTQRCDSSVKEPYSGPFGRQCSEMGRRVYPGEFGLTQDRWFCPDHFSEWVYGPAPECTEEEG